MKFMRISLLVAVGFLIYSFFFVHDMGMYSDEIYHWPQAEAFIKNTGYVNHSITTFLTYHKFAKLYSALTGFNKLEDMRSLNTILACFMVPLFYLLNLTSGTKYPVQRTWQMIFLPTLFVYYFVFYTDVASLFVVLIGCCFLFKNRPNLAAIFFVLSSFIRQTNVVFLFFILMFNLLKDSNSFQIKDYFIKLLKKRFLIDSSISILGIVGFATFFIINNGIALGDASRHMPGLYFGNIIFALMLIFILFIPLNITLFKRAEFGNLNKVVLILIFLFFGSAIIYSKVDHEFNLIPRFIRNDLLMYSYSNPILKLIYFLPAVLGLLALLKTKLADKCYYSIYPTALLALIPAHLIEHRYSIPFFILFLATRECESEFVENLMATFSLIISLILLYGVSSGRFMI